MTQISVKGKEGRFGSMGGDFWTDDGHHVYVGKNWALQNEIEESRIQTKSRSCYRECLSCGCCGNSIRDGASCSSQYDANSGKTINCRSCEKFRFCDCRNGWFRDAHGDAEPFTPDVIKMLKETGGKPHIGVTP